MNELRDPPRLFDSPDAPEGLRAMLDAAQRDALKLQAVERVAAGAVAELGTPHAIGSGGEGAAAAQGTWGTGVVGKVVVGLAAVALVAGGAWLAARPTGAGSSSDTAVVVHAPSAAPAAESPSGGEARVPEDEPSERVESPPAWIGPSSVPEVQKPKGSVPAASAPRSSGKEAVSGSTSVETLGEEHRILREARRQLAADPQLALALTQEHARRFPGGILAQEREVIAIEALSRLGKTKEARDRAHGFQKQYPGSPHQGQVDTATKSSERRP